MTTTYPIGPQIPPWCPPQYQPQTHFCGGAWQCPGCGTYYAYWVHACHCAKNNKVTRWPTSPTVTFQTSVREEGTSTNDDKD